MLLIADLYFSTENNTGMSEVKKIDVPVQDLNNLDDCEDTKEECPVDPIYYFIYSECILFIYTVIDYAIYFLCSYRAF